MINVQRNNRRSFATLATGGDQERLALRQCRNIGCIPAIILQEKILLQMEDQDVIDIFRVTEEEAQATGELSPSNPSMAAAKKPPVLGSLVNSMG